MVGQVELKMGRATLRFKGEGCGCVVQRHVGSPRDKHTVMGSYLNTARPKTRIVLKQVRRLALIGPAYELVPSIGFDNHHPREVRVGVQFIGFDVPDAQVLIRDENTMAGQSLVKS